MKWSNGDADGAGAGADTGAGAAVPGAKVVTSASRKSRKNKELPEARGGLATIPRTVVPVARGSMSKPACSEGSEICYSFRQLRRTSHEEFLVIFSISRL
jgi:hypothetical protein